MIGVGILAGCLVARDGRAAAAWRTALAVGAAEATAGSCVPNANRLCLNDNRFEVTSTWRTADGQTGNGRAVALTADTGYFWFFGSSNVEVVVKVLDGCGVNQRFWTFAAGLTDVKVDLFVKDTVTGSVRIYRNTQGTAFRPVADTAAFATCSAAARERQAVGALRAGANLGLSGNRFTVVANWRSGTGASGTGQGVPVTNDTGYFWFFSPANVETIVKVLDGCAVNGKFWVFAAGLTDVQVDLTVVDNVTGLSKTYGNPLGTLFQPVQDTGALSCSGDVGLPPDPGEAGKIPLGGIDSDGDGLRDDLQRYVVLTYGGSPGTVDALKSATRIVQGAILDSGSRARSLDHATDLSRAQECLRYTRPADADGVGQALLARALNTEARGLAYLAFNDQLGGSAFPVTPPTQWSASCGAAAGAVTRLGVDTLTAAPLASCSQTAKATVFFGNGVWNTCADAQASADTLRLGLDGVLSAEEKSSVVVAAACNPTRGVIADLWLSWKQSISSDFSAFFRALSGLDPLPDSIRQRFLDISAGITSGAAVADPTLANHLGVYKSLLFEGQKVIVAAHSQGNFYANLASDALFSDPITNSYADSFGIVSIANPDSRVATSSDWTTFSNDLVVNVVRPFTGALTGNAGVHLNLFADWTSHEFVDSYFVAGSATRSRIVGQIRSELDSLPVPTNPAGNGVITVTLTWDHATDVDLHVFEPHGTHVYYLQLVGESGFLDRDNITGFGPEHYFVACDDLQAGTYRIGVNYYSGSVVETAHVQVAAGLVVRSFSLTLPQSRGSGGNGSPIPVADIVVTGSTATGFTFEVRPLL